MATKFYAVRVGKIPGIYTSWNDCKAVVHGYPAAEYKSFSSMQEAQKYIDFDKDKELIIMNGNIEKVLEHLEPERDMER